MELFHVVIRNFDDESDIDYVTKKPVSHGEAIGIDRMTEMNLEEYQYTEIIKVD